MLGQRCRRWTNIDPTLGDYFLFAGRYVHNKHETFTQCLINVGPPSAQNENGWTFCVSLHRVDKLGSYAASNKNILFLQGTLLARL